MGRNLEKNTKNIFKKISLKHLNQLDKVRTFLRHRTFAQPQYLEIIKP